MLYVMRQLIYKVALAYCASDSLELSKNAVNEPALIGLLTVYKEYYSDVIVGQSGAGNLSLFEVIIP